VTGYETGCNIGICACFVKSPITQSVLSKYQPTTHPKRRCWQFCWHFCWHRKAEFPRSCDCRRTARHTIRISRLRVEPFDDDQRQILYRIARGPNVDASRWSGSLFWGWHLSFLVLPHATLFWTVILSMVAGLILSSEFPALLI
jgi:hypothetical protein